MKGFIIISVVLFLQIIGLQAGNFADNRDSRGRNGGGSSGGNGDRGSWGVSVNKDKGRGPQVRTEGSGNIYSSRDGNWRVNAHGHHEMGKGRKPDVGGGVSVTGRWRRDAENLISEGVEIIDESELTRMKRSFAPGGKSFPSPSGSQGDRGSWGVSVNKDKGRGPQVRTEGQGNIYTSPKGNVRVDGQGHHEFGKGRKPSYGGGVSATGRWRRDLDDEVVEGDQAVEDSEATRMKRSFAPDGKSFPTPSGSQGDRGSWGVSVNKDKGRGPQVRTEGQGNIYKSPNGNMRVDGHGHHEFGKGRKPSYGGGVSATGRWRRDADDEVVEDHQVVEDSEVTRMKRSFAPGGNSFPNPSGSQGDRGSWDVSVNKDKGRGPQVRTEGQGNIYTSPNGKVRVDGHGHHEFGKGRKPSYGGGVKVHGRWRREADDEADFDDLPEVSRVRRQSNGSRGQIGMTVDRGHIRTDGSYNVYKSPNGNWRADANGFHEAGRGIKPIYGGGLSVTNDGRGQLGTNVQRLPGGGAHVRTDGNYNFYTSPHGNWRVNGNGFHEAGRGMKPNYGGGVSVTGRFRRETPDDLEDVEGRVRRAADPKDPRGQVDVTIDHQHGRGPQIRTDGRYNIYTSPNGNWQVNGNGYHQAGRGMKPNYGAGVSVTGRFRRDVSEIDEQGFHRNREESNDQWV